MLIFSELEKAIQQMQPQNIVVLGDYMLDQYTVGAVERISPESPVPVLWVNEQRYKAGGAANIVANIATLGSVVVPIGAIGQDSPARQLLNLFEQQGIDHSGILQSANLQTTVKSRFSTEQQQLLRVDYERPYTLEPADENWLLDMLQKAMPKADGVILSDYSKGGLTQKLIRTAIQLARQKNIPIVCDPGPKTDWQLYSGVTTIKPNRKEAENFSQLVISDTKNMLEAADKIQKSLKTEFVSLSLDKTGILVYYSPTKYHLLRTEAKEVYDVAGAGDTMVSILGLMLSAKQNTLLAAQTANLAASLSVSFQGVVNPSWAEILAYLKKNQHQNKIISLQQMVEILEKREEQLLPLIFTNGYFDQLNSPQLRFLLEFEKFNGETIVAINSDQSIKRQKGSLPLIDQQARAQLLASLPSVDWVIIFEQATAEQLILELKPSIVVKGEQFKKQQLAEQTALEQVGAELRYLPNY